MENSYIFFLNALAFPGQRSRHTPTVGNMKIAFLYVTALLLHPHTGVPYSLVECIFSLDGKLYLGDSNNAAFV